MGKGRLGVGRLLKKVPGAWAIPGALGAVLLSLTVSLGAHAQPCRLRVGLDQWAPYQYRDAKGRAQGLDVDLLRLYGRLTHCRLSFVSRPWSRQLRDLKTGRLDLVPGASMTPGRQQYARFSNAYRRETMRLFVSAQSAADFSFTDFRQMIPVNFRLGVTLGYYYGSDFQAAMGDPAFRALVTEVPDMSQNFRMLAAGHVNGAIADTLVGAYWIRKLRLEGQVVMVPMQVNSDNIHLMFSSQTVAPALVERFNEAIGKAQKDGSFTQIMQRYGH